MISIQPVGFDGGRLESFLDLPRTLQASCPGWIPTARDRIARQLDPALSPYWRQADRELFVALEGGRVVGRILATDDQQFNHAQGGNLGFFGGFDCVDDQRVADALLTAAAGWLRVRGRERMRGPFTPYPDAPDLGLLLAGSALTHSFVEPANPPWYQNLLETHGLVKLSDYVSLRTRVSCAENPRANQLNARLRRHFRSLRNLRVRPFDPAQLDRDLDIAQQILGDAYADEPVWALWSKPMQRHIQNLLAPHNDWSLCFIAEIADVPAGIWLATPNYPEPVDPHAPASPLEPGICVYDFAVAPKFHKTQAATALVQAFWDEAQRQDYAYTDICYVREDNRESLALADAFGATLTKRFRIYEMPIAAGLEADARHA